jgi:hypothetical protein
VISASAIAQNGPRPLRLSQSERRRKSPREACPEYGHCQLQENWLSGMVSNHVFRVLSRCSMADVYKQYFAAIGNEWQRIVSGFGSLSGCVRDQIWGYSVSGCVRLCPAFIAGLAAARRLQPGRCHLSGQRPKARYRASGTFLEAVLEYQDPSAGEIARMRKRTSACQKCSSPGTSSTE